MDVDAFVKREIARLCSVEPSTLSDGGKLVGYGLDSVGLQDLLIAIEDAYDLEIDELDPRLVGVKTVGQLVAYVQGRLSEG